MESIDLWASDIHIEPEENRVRIRARVDWVLQQIGELPIQISKWFTNSIKTYFGFADSYKTNETYDERISAYYHNKDKIEYKVVVLPLQVGHVTITIPLGSIVTNSHFLAIFGLIQSSWIDGIISFCISKRATIVSQKLVGIRENLISTFLSLSLLLSLLW